MLRLSTRSGRLVKRTIDIAASLSGLLVLWPLFLVLAVLIKIDSHGPVFFRQVRVGRYGRPFRMWKLRSMRPDAERSGPGLTTSGDERVTRVGRVLRASKVDELPQLMNVLVGDMTLVGPRPELPSFVDHYRPDERVVLDVRPGITDPASILYRNEEAVLADVEDPLRHYREVLLHDKIALNLEYQRNATVFSDLGIVWDTLVTLIRRTS